MLAVNGLLIGPVSPCKELLLCLRDRMETDTIEEDMQMPMPTKLEEFQTQQPDIKKEEPHIKKEEGETESIFVDDEKKKEAAYGFLGGGLAGLSVGGIASAIEAGLGSSTATGTYATLNETVPTLTQSTNIIKDLISVIQSGVENVDEILKLFRTKPDPDKEPLIKPDPDGVAQETSPEREQTIPTDTELGEPPDYPENVETLYQTKEHSSNVNVEQTVELQPWHINYANVSTEGGPPLYTAISSKPVINYEAPTKIPLPPKTNINYPQRKYTPLERWTKTKTCCGINKAIEERERKFARIGQIFSSCHSSK
ncbi:hypothetical protein ACTXT7_017445 [Hymenolepis weldensis]